MFKSIIMKTKIEPTLKKEFFFNVKFINIYISPQRTILLLICFIKIKCAKCFPRTQQYHRRDKCERDMRN